MSFIKKIFAFCLAVIFIFTGAFTLLPKCGVDTFFVASAAVETGYYYDVSAGKATITDVSDSMIRGHVKVPDKLGGYPVTAIGDSAFYNCSSLENIIIPEGVTTIGQAAFRNCWNLTSVTLPSTLTSIASDAFRDCGDSFVVYYAGTESQWDSVSVGTNNNSLTSSVIDFGHTHLYTVNVTSEPACFRSGYATYTCSQGESYTDILQPRHTDSNFDTVCDVCRDVTEIENSINPGERRSIYIDAAEVVTMAFTPAVTGTYSFYSVSDTDTKVELYQDNECLEEADDIDVDSDRDFCITYDLEAGKTYFYFISFWDDDECGTIDVVLVEGEADLSGDGDGGYEDDNIEFSGTLVLNEREDIYLGEGEAVILSFTPAVSANYIFTSIGDYDTIAYLFTDDDDSLDENDDESYEDGLYNFRLEHYLTAGVTYYFEVAFCDEEESGSFQVLLTKEGDEGTTSSLDVSVSDPTVPSMPDVDPPSPDITVTTTTTAEEESSDYSEPEEEPPYSDYDETTDDEENTWEDEENTYEEETTEDEEDSTTEDIEPTDEDSDSIDYVEYYYDSDSELIVSLGEYEIARIYFTPEITGSYTFRAESDDDTYGCICDAETGEKIISGDDESEENWDFALTCNLQAGKTYYLDAYYYFYQETGGSFSVTVERNEEPSTVPEESTTEPREESTTTPSTAPSTAPTTAPTTRPVVPTTAKPTVTAHVHSFSSQWTIDKAATCTQKGSKSRHCTSCGAKTNVTEISATGHKFVNTGSVKATLKKDGANIKSCLLCSAKETTPIYKVATVKLSKKEYTYNGKAKKPGVIVKDSSGKTLEKNIDYTVKYAKGRKNPGTYSVKITFKGNYSGKKTLKFKIVLSKVKGIKQLARTGIQFIWDEVKGATGYEVYLYDDVIRTYKLLARTQGASLGSSTAKGKMKFKIRAFRKKGKKTYYGKYSATKTFTGK